MVSYMEKEIIINEYDDPDKFDVHKIEDFSMFLQEIAPIINFINFGYDASRKTANGTYIYKKTSKEMPYTYKFDIMDLNIFYVDKEFYKENEKGVKKVLLDVIKNTKSSEFSIGNSELIDDEIIDALASNHNIKKYEFHDGYTISKEYISKLKQNPNIEQINVSKVEDDIKFIYDRVVNAGNQNDICGLSVASINKLSERDDELYYSVNRDYSDEELDDLRKLVQIYPIQEIRIYFYNKTQMDKILEIFKDSKVSINYGRSFSIDEVKKIENYENVVFSDGGNKYTPTQVRRREEILDLIINEVREQDLSSLEQYMYLYNTVKLFKEYKESNENKQLSRVSEYILDNDYMVCVGYASLLNELVERLDNPNIRTTTFSLDVGDKGEKKSGHKRVLVNIKDDKYNVDGIYISDPTWDCVTYYKKKKIDGKVEIDYTKPISHVDKYSYFLLTKDEVDSDKYEYDPSITDIIFSKNPKQTIHEFTMNNKEYKVSDSVLALKHLFNNNDITEENLLEYCMDVKQPFIEGDTLINCITNLYSKIYKDTPLEKRQEIIENTIYNNNLLQKHNFGEDSEKFSK